MKKTSILIIDDHAILRDGLRLVLNSATGFVVCGEAGTARQGLKLFHALKPDITILDLLLPDQPGVELLTEMLNYRPTARIIVLTTATGDEDIHQAQIRGAAGYIFKSTPASELISALRTAAAGLPTWPENVTARLADRDESSRLTERENEVLQLIAKGYSNKMIAAALNISEFTCKIHVHNLLSKLKAGDRTEAVVIAVQRGIVKIG